MSPLVVAVHGLEDDARGWDPLAGLLPVPLVAVDLPWRSGNDYTWRATGGPGRQLAAALAPLTEPDVLIGHSFGANAILELLATGTVRPRCAVLLAPFYRPPSLVDSPGTRRRARAGFAEIITAGMRVKLGDRAGRLDADLLATMAGGLCERLLPVAFPVLYDAFLTTTDLPLAGVDVPTLVLAGPDDNALAGERAPALAAAMPAASVRVRPGLSHFCHLEQVAAVATELTAFLNHHLPVPHTPLEVR